MTNLQLNPKKLTVAILTYNRKEYLHECLESLQRQTWKDFSVIIFDNASDYDVSEFVTLFPELTITVNVNEKNIGGINNFIKVVNYKFVSPYVMMFHDDDTLHQDYFEKAIPVLDDHSQIVWVGSNIRFITNATTKKMLHFPNNISSEGFVEYTQEELIKKLLKGFSLGFGSVIYRKEVLYGARLRNEEFDKWLDRPFIIDLAAGGNTVGIATGTYVNYRVHTGQDSQHPEQHKLQYSINLFKYYREKSTNKNKWWFKQLLADSAINTSFHFATTFTTFFSVLYQFKREKLFACRYVSYRGVYYFAKFVIKYIKL